MKECENDYQRVLSRLYLRYGKVLQIREIAPLPYFNRTRHDFIRPEEIEDIEDIQAAMSREGQRPHPDMEMPEKKDRHSKSPPRLPNVSTPLSESPQNLRNMDLPAADSP